VCQAYLARQRDFSNFALALVALFRRRAVAVTVSIGLTVIPFLLTFVNLAPVSQWLLQFTPAAGFAIQQSIPVYPQVADMYTPQAGYYPLAPWAGFAVLCGYAVLALSETYRKQLNRRGTRPLL
jgi:uncharacterized membrane protein